MKQQSFKTLNFDNDKFVQVLLVNPDITRDDLHTKAVTEYPQLKGKFTPRHVSNILNMMRDSGVVKSVMRTYNTNYWSLAPEVFELAKKGLGYDAIRKELQKQQGVTVIKVDPATLRR